jgi:hypothetical protein
MTKKCWNYHCREVLPIGVLCPSCWWMAKVGIGAGAATLLVVTWLIGLVSKASFTLPAWVH